MLNSPFQDEEFFYGGKRQNRRDVSKRANRDHKFAFDVVFGPQSSNEDVFRETTRDLVDVLFAGMANTKARNRSFFYKRVNSNNKIE